MGPTPQEPDRHILICHHEPITSLQPALWPCAGVKHLIAHRAEVEATNAGSSISFHHGRAMPELECPANDDRTIAVVVEMPQLVPNIKVLKLWAVQMINPPKSNSND